jgi:hypothetical protein
LAAIADDGFRNCLCLRSLARSELTTLYGAATYIAKPKGAHATAKWQAAIEVLLLIADLGGPNMFARIGVGAQPPSSRTLRSPDENGL